jgi:prepilin-type N-terminal cleavage/methylation domain-containing protein
VAEQLIEPAERTGERGFTLIEVLIALLILMVGMAGILSLQLTSMKATSFSRHATEASSLAEDKVEELRTVPLNSVRFANGTDQVDSRGVADAEGLFTRTWTIAPGIETTIVNVSVSWTERGNEPYTISMADMRTGTPP